MFKYDNEQQAQPHRVFAESFLANRGSLTLKKEAMAVDNGEDESLSGQGVIGMMISRYHQELALNSCKKYVSKAFPPTFGGAIVHGAPFQSQGYFQRDLAHC